jgi:hypothetical protein
VTARPVFVSYSQPDREAAFAVVAALEVRGIECWIAPRDITPGTEWAAEVLDAIVGARVMVLVFSASTDVSPQVRREVERAVHRGVPVLTFRVADVMPSKSLEYFLSSQHWLDAFPAPLDTHCLRLGHYVETLLAPAAPQAPAPSAPSLDDTRPAMAAALDPAKLKRLEGELAGYIGPVAGYLVRHAAVRVAGTEALIARLSEEIESETDRRRFAEICRQFL